MTAGERLRAWRKENNYSSKYVAEQIGVSDPTISQFEIGKSQLKAGNLQQLHEVFNLSIDWLLSGVDGSIPVDQKELNEIYEQLPPDRREDLLDTARMYLGKSEKQPKSSDFQKAG